MLKQKLIAHLKILVMLSSVVASVSMLNLNCSSKEVFSGTVYAAPLIPIEGALVTASGPNGFGYAPTNSSGHYTITEGLVAGNYTVTVSANGYLDAEIDNVAVTSGVETSNVNFLLDVSGAISGKVTDANSSLPLQGVTVIAVNATGGMAESALTDVNGDYMINTNLDTGTYNVTASYSLGHVMEEVGGVAVTAGLETKNVDMALQSSGIIFGTVTDSVTDAPLPNVYVVASMPGGIFGGSAGTNESGQYTIDTNLATGTYDVSANYPEGHVPKTVSGIMVTGGSETAADFALDPSGIISGRVTRTSDGQAIEDANVNANSEDFTYLGSTVTNSDGYYNISSGLGTGTYTVNAFSGFASNMTVGVSVIAGSETSNVNIMLDIPPSGTISGRVTNLTGSPIPFASIQAEGPAGFGNAVTDSNGNYTISSGLGTGTYTVNASAPGYATVSMSDVNITVNEVTPNVDFQLPFVLSGRISGRVESEFSAIPEFPQPILVLLFAASLIAVAFATLHSMRRRRTEPV